MSTADSQWNVQMMSLRHQIYDTSIAMARPQEGIQNLEAAYKQHNSTVKRFGRALAFKRRAVAITKLDPVSHFPMAYTRDDSLTKYVRRPSLLQEVVPAAFFAQYRMLDVNDPGYDGHVCLVYLETNDVAVSVFDWIVKLGVQVGIHELIRLAVEGGM